MEVAVFGPAGPGALKPAKAHRRRDPVERWARGCPCCAYMRVLLCLALVWVALYAAQVGLVIVAAQAPVCEGYVSDRGECG